MAKHLQIGAGRCAIAQSAMQGWGHRCARGAIAIGAGSDPSAVQESASAFGEDARLPRAQSSFAAAPFNLMKHMSGGAAPALVINLTARPT
ncbi:MAG: hypothetical protein LW719_04820 [Comamonadaceae bacterium]|nr:hypothetical protein [Comamonadaceae bacterium]